MSSSPVPSNPSEPPPEIVIIRRRPSAAEEGSHGGIWKIAYADFMTAMMAFFLVMWLINATDRQTMSGVAAYFDPVKLSQHVASPKGLHDPESGARGKESAPGESRSREGTSRGDPRAEAVRGPGRPDSLVSARHVVAVKRAASIPGEAFRTPFEPELPLLATRAGARAALLVPHWLGREVSGARPDLGTEPDAADAADATAPPVPRPEAEDMPDQTETAAASALELTRSDIDQEIRAQLNQSAFGRHPNLEVTSTPEGVLISLTDDQDFGMFAIASAEPRPELVAIMERIAVVLMAHPGALVVRGHTDGRPFRSPTYDNWRLSSARAHTAYAMLVSGGVDERRFERIEGHADRSLRVAADPEAAQNRRIEILLRRTGPS